MKEGDLVFHKHYTNGNLIYFAVKIIKINIRLESFDGLLIESNHEYKTMLSYNFSIRDYSIISNKDLLLRLNKILIFSS
jgi:hypothetical protein